MKVNTFFKYTGFIMALMAVSCVGDTFVDNHGRVEEGLPARVQLGFKTQEGPVMTRAEQDIVSENRVDNIYVIVFDEAGNRHFGDFFIPGERMSYDDGNDKYSSGTISFKTTSLNNARIVGIANLTTTTTSTAYSITEETLGGVKTLDELKALVMKMKDESIYRSALFMMTGYAKDKDNPDSEVVTIPGGEGSVQTLDATLQLERTDAKVKFVVKTDPNPPAGEEWLDFSFMPKTWIVKRVPKQSYILEAESGDYGGDDAGYFNTNAIQFEEITRDEKDPNLYTGGSFIFYMPENVKTPKKNITATWNSSADYALREAWEGNDSNGDKKFLNANDNSTYVEMTGTLSYRVDGGNLVNADVRLTVHLGYAKDGNGNTDVNDYATNRNCYYTYNVIVGGVEDIKLEVESQEGEEPRPGYEGDVVYSSSQVYEFDSHYDRRLISINLDNLKDNVFWSVNTPFSRGIHQVVDADDKIPEDMRDYRWIKFAINADYGVNASQYVKYPGDQNYNDPYPVEGAISEEDYNAPSPYYGNNYRDARLLDIQQLLVRLKSMVKEGETGEVAITVFVDENLYFNHPLTGESGENNRSLWKLTADKDDRQMHLIVSNAYYSTDGESSTIYAQYSFKQRTIRTIFNVDKEGLNTAWGLESTMETGRMSAGGVSNGSSTSNGRMNTLRCILGPNESNKVYWTDIIGTEDPENPYELKGNQQAVRACLLRNRDLNGNNIVDANEIRWYLASIDQLTDIYLGEYALDEQSRLYPSNPADRENKVRWHYTSSSANGDGSWILWAEEGASRGGSGGSADDSGVSGSNTEFSYRCVRNLGISLDNPEEIPQDLITVTDEGNGFYLIDATNMSVQSRRTNSAVRLSAHDERDADNRPYAKFRVHKSYYPSSQQNWSYFQNYNGYPEGYRIPNQRELLIMATRIPAEGWETPYFYYCQTAFSMDGQWPYSPLRDGFYFDSKNRYFILQNNYETGYVRPVQDVAE